MHVKGSLANIAPALGVFAGRSEGLTRRALVDRAAGSVHQELVHHELVPGGRVDRHLHAFEESLYLLEGALEVEIAGTREELAADDYLWIEVGTSHALVNPAGRVARWLEVSAPIPGSALEDTLFTGGKPAVEPDVTHRRGRFDVDELPEPSDTFGLEA